MLVTEEAYKQWKPQKVPYGYRKNKEWKPVIHPTEAEVVREVYHYIESWYTVPQVCKMLMDNKVLNPTWSGSDSTHAWRIRDVYKWDDKTVRSILKNDFYTWILYYWKTKVWKKKADWKHHQIFIDKSLWKVSEIKHVPIISISTFTKVWEILEKKKWNFLKSKNQYILSTLIKCWYCEEHRPIHGVISWSWIWWNKGEYYSCNWKKAKNLVWDYKCPVIQLWKHELEELVLREVKWIFSNIKNLSAYLEEKEQKSDIIKDMEKRYNKINDDIATCMNAVESIKLLAESGRISPHEVLWKIEAQETKLSELKFKRAKMDQTFDTYTNYDKYKKSLQIIEYIIKNDIDTFFQVNSDTQNLLNLLIENIYIYARDRNETDVIKWVKKEGQKVPYKIKITFKLPQEFLRDYMKFSIK